MFQLDRCRAAAKREAWYGDGSDDGIPNYNPFRKINTRTRSKGPSDEENLAIRTTTNRSENFATSTLEDQRRSKNMEENRMPKHAETMPSHATGISSKLTVGPVSDVKDMAEEPQDITEHEKEHSQDSGTSSEGKTSETIVGSEPQINGNAKPRRRKFPFIGKSNKGDQDEIVEKPRRQSSLFRKDPQKFTLVGQLKATLLNSWINVLLIFVPIGIAVNFADSVPKVGVFVINFIAIIPLAAMLSYATEEIALRTGETIGGLLNATFG